MIFVVKIDANLQSTQEVFFTSTAKLTLETAGEVIFTGDLDLALGSELEIK